MGGCGWRFDILVDPGAIRAARNASAEREIALVARSEMQKSGARLPPAGTPVALDVTLAFGVPESRRRRRKHMEPPEEGSPCVLGGMPGCARYAVAVSESVAAAWGWPDSGIVTRISVASRWTYGAPRIEVVVRRDGGRRAGGTTHG